MHENKFLFYLILIKYLFKLFMVFIVASKEEMTAEYFRYFVELENERLDEEAYVVKDKSIVERISSLHEDIEDLKK